MKISETLAALQEIRKSAAHSGCSALSTRPTVSPLWRLARLRSAVAIQGARSHSRAAIVAVQRLAGRRAWNHRHAPSVRRVGSPLAVMVPAARRSGSPVGLPREPRSAVRETPPLGRRGFLLSDESRHVDGHHRVLPSGVQSGRCASYAIDFARAYPYRGESARSRMRRTSATTR